MKKIISVNKMKFERIDYLMFIGVILLALVAVSIPILIMVHGTYHRSCYSTSVTPANTSTVTPVNTTPTTLICPNTTSAGECLLSASKPARIYPKDIPSNLARLLTDSNAQSVAMSDSTLSQATVWAEVDLGQPAYIKHIKILGPDNTTDAKWYRRFDVYVDGKLYSQFDGMGTPNSMQDLYPPNNLPYIKGQVVRVQMQQTNISSGDPGANILRIAEIQIWGYG